MKGRGMSGGGGDKRGKRPRKRDGWRMERFENSLL